MKFLRAYYWSLILAVATAASLLFLGGCASMNTGGPTQPLLPQLTAEEKFSDRFQLEEEPFFFYDLFGRELLEGNEVHQYIEEKQFDAAGNLVLGRTGQLDSVRYVSQLDRTVLTEDTYRGRHTEFTIGDHLTIKEKTLFPMTYIMHKTEFDGFRWDLSFQSSKHLFSILNSRISNPLYAADVGAAGSLAPTLGRRNSDAFLENKRLVGFRGQGMIGDILRVGFTYINLHKEHPQRLDNPWTGTVANTPPEQIVLTFRDNSPEDYMKGSDANGAKVAWIKFHIKTYDPESKVWDTKIVEKGQSNFTRTLIPEENPYSKGGESDGDYWAANGFDSFQCVLDMDKEKIDPKTVQSLVVEMKMKGDYWVDVLGYSSKNKGDAAAPWPKTETGVIDMPYRDVIERPGNDPDNLNKAQIVRYEYGSARGAALWGVDLEGTVPYLGYIQAQYAVNPKYKQYPTISKDKIDYSQKKADNPDDPTARTFSEVDGHRFDSTSMTKDVGGSYSNSADKSYFVNLKQRFGKFFLEESYFHVDPGWTTTYPGFGGNSDRDETYKIPRTSETTDSTPFDSPNYQLVEDDDDDDDFPDSDDFDGVLPRADDRDMNGVLDYQEDFLIFEADPPVFEQTEDLNNNRILDNLEDDYDPDYKYGADVKGYHLVGSYDILANMTMKLGWLNEKQISSARKTNSKYVQLNYERDIPDFGTLLFQNRLVRVQDNIIDYAITLRVGEVEPTEVRDELDFYDAMYDTATFQLTYTGIPRLKLITKYLLSFEKHYSPADADKIRKDDTSTEIDEAIDFMLEDKQLRSSGDLKEYAFNGMDPVLAFDQANWIPRRYKDATVKFNTFIFKTSYEIPIGKLPVIKLFGEGMTLTPMFKWVFERNWDRKWSDSPLDPTQVSPTDYQSEEYLRFNQNTRETIGLIRLDYVFTPSLNILGGFQYRRLINKDINYKLKFLKPWGEDVKTPIQWRAELKKRIWALQAINQGEWLGFNIRVLVGFKKTTILPTILYTGKKKPSTTSTETYVRALMGF